MYHYTIKCFKWVSLTCEVSGEVRVAKSTEVGVVLLYLVMSLITSSPLKVRVTTPVPFSSVCLLGRYLFFSAKHQGRLKVAWSTEYLWKINKFLLVENPYYENIEINGVMMQMKELTLSLCQHNAKSSRLCQVSINTQMTRFHARLKAFCGHLIDIFALTKQKQ